jgi:OHCU decarboxylase
VTLDDLNALPHEVATRVLARCCGSSRWAAGVVGRRPFRNVEQLCAAADDVWWTLEGGDWLEAFSHHPRIGARSTGLSQQEQAGVNGAPDETLRELVRLNQTYERKFGHVFLISATGRSADEMLAALRERMSGDPATELRNAAAEQAKITRLRLQNLVQS